MSPAGLWSMKILLLGQDQILFAVQHPSHLVPGVDFTRTAMGVISNSKRELQQFVFKSKVIYLHSTWPHALLLPLHTWPVWSAEHNSFRKCALPRPHCLHRHRTCPHQLNFIIQGPLGGGLRSLMSPKYVLVFVERWTLGSMGSTFCTLCHLIFTKTI